MREEDMSREANEDVSPLSLDIGDEGGMYDEFGYGYVSTAPHFQRLQDDLVKAASIVVSSIEPGEMQEARAKKRMKRGQKLKNNTKKSKFDNLDDLMLIKPDSPEYKALNEFDKKTYDIQSKGTKN